MYFSCILYTCGITLVFVQGQEFPHKEPDGPHNYTHFGHCRKAAEFPINRMNAALKPRERHVILNPKPGYEFTPNTVAVNRCNGNCPARFSPMPIKTAPKSFIVNLHRKGEKMTPTNCVSVTVEEHTNCMCKCMKDKSHCNELQDFTESSCKCECKDRLTEKRECEAIRKMVWNDDTCSCQCVHKIMDCPHGMMWDKTICACMPSSD